MNLSRRSFTSFLRKAWDFLYTFFDITDQRHIFLLSAGIAFNLLLCTIPLVVLVLSIVSGVIDEDQTKSTVEQFLVNFLPNNIQASTLIGEVIKELSSVFNYSTVAGWIAAIALLWLSSALFSSLRNGLNAIFHNNTSAFLILVKIRSKLKDMLLTIVTAVLIVFLTLLSPLITVLEGSWTNATVQLILFGAAVCVFFFMYRFIPNKRLPWMVVIVATVSAVGLWEIARVLFSWYVNTVTNFSRFYGGFVAIASFALWLYYSALVFLLSAELGQYVHSIVTEKRPPKA